MYVLNLYHSAGSSCRLAGMAQKPKGILFFSLTTPCQRSHLHLPSYYSSPFFASLPLPAFSFCTVWLCLGTVSRGKRYCMFVCRTVFLQLFVKCNKKNFLMVGVGMPQLSQFILGDNRGFTFQFNLISILDNLNFSFTFQGK